MGRLVIDTLELSRRIQRDEGLGVRDADARAHDLMFGVLSAQTDGTASAIAPMIEPLGIEQLSFRLMMLGVPQDFWSVVQKLQGGDEHSV